MTQGHRSHRTRPATLGTKQEQPSRIRGSEKPNRVIPAGQAKLGTTRQDNHDKMTFNPAQTHTGGEMGMEVGLESPFHQNAHK